MRWMRYVRRARRDADFAEELRSYIDIETDENIARGMTPVAARAAAVRKFGNPTRAREDVYLMNTIQPIDTLWQDLRYALRVLIRDKGFAIAAVLSLTLGIGANTAIFQLLDAVRLRSLPVAKPQELAEIRIGSATGRSGTFTGQRPNLTYPIWDELQQRQQAFASLFAWGARRFNTSVAGEAHFVEGLLVSGGYFTELNVSPLLGRVFTPADDRRGCGISGAVISHAYWQRELGGDRAVLSRTIFLDGVTFPIIGVTPPSFFGMEVGRRYDVAVLLCADDAFAGQLLSTFALNQPSSRLDRRDLWWLAVVGRLKSGWTVERATEHLRSISSDVFEATLPSTYRTEEATKYRAFELNAFPAGTGVSNLRASFQDPLLLLLITAGLVLLIACANLANLLLARASARGRELAVRIAIGASRSRLVRQLLVESALLAIVGAVLGGIVASALSRLLIGVLAGDNPAVWVDLTWNWRMLGFTSAVALAACLLFGVTPALRATALPPGAALKLAGRGSTASRERFGLRSGLVMTQVALSLVLLLGALLFMRTLYNLLAVDPGFDHSNVVVARLSQVSRAGADLTRDPVEANRDLQERLAALPDVKAVAQADVVPLGRGGFWNEVVRVEGAPAPSNRVSNFNRVSVGFFAALDVRLVTGRDFADADDRASAAVAIVSRAFVERFVPDGPALGRVIRVDGPAGEPEPAYEIVGVVEDTRLMRLRDDIEPMVYLASTQQKHADAGAQFVLRPRGSAAAMMPAVSRVIAQFNPTANVEFYLLETSIKTSLLRERLMASLSAAFGILAIVLAAIGLYGVMSYAVASRTNEIGIRIAVGAQRRDVITMVLGQASRLMLAGIAVGTALALAGGRFAHSLLFQLNPTDATTVAIAIALLTTVGLTAGLIPARRAARIDPASAIRNE